MAILLRHKNGRWIKVASAAYDDESHLQRLLYDSPELIPLPSGDDIPRVFIREAGLPGSGSTDLLGVDSEANIYLVECKLAVNREVRRQVIGQCLEYAAFRGGKSFEEFDGLFISRGRKSLLEAFEEKKIEGWSPDSFEERVTRRLKEGTFHLIIVVDDLNPELERIISYLAERRDGYQLEVLALKLYQEDETEIIVPTLRGRNAVSSTRTEPAAKQTMEEVLDRCSSPEGRARLKHLIEMWTDLGNTAEPRTSGISFRASIGDQVRHIFWASTPDILTVTLGGFRSMGLPAENVEIHRKRLTEIGGFVREKVLSQKSPRALFEEMTDTDIEAFVRASQDLVDEWRKVD